jgi:hypothetical protein
VIFVPLAPRPLSFEALLGVSVRTMLRVPLAAPRSVEALVRSALVPAGENAAAVCACSASANSARLQASRAF